MFPENQIVRRLPSLLSSSQPREHTADDTDRTAKGNASPAPNTDLRGRQSNQETSSRSTQPGSSGASNPVVGGARQHSDPGNKSVLSSQIPRLFRSFFFDNLIERNTPVI